MLPSFFVLSGQSAWREGDETTVSFRAVISALLSVFCDAPGSFEIISRRTEIFSPRETTLKPKMEALTATMGNDDDEDQLSSPI